MRTLFLFLIAGVLALTASAAAQTIATSYELQIFSPGVPTTGTPISTSAIPLTAVTCNLAPPVVPGTVSGARFIYWDDIALAGRTCRVDRFTFLLALPIANNYVATMTAIHTTAGTSARSAASNPFNVVLLPPAVPTGVVAIP